jgi:hypothetical protein
VESVRYVTGDLGTAKPGFAFIKFSDAAGGGAQSAQEAVVDLDGQDWEGCVPGAVMKVEIARGRWGN